MSRRPWWRDRSPNTRPSFVGTSGDISITSGDGAGLRIANTGSLYVDSTITASDVMYGENGTSMVDAMSELDNRILNLEADNPHMRGPMALFETLALQGYSTFELEQSLITMMDRNRTGDL